MIIARYDVLCPICLSGYKTIFAGVRIPCYTDKRWTLIGRVVLIYFLFGRMAGKNGCGLISRVRFHGYYMFTYLS